MKLTIEQVDHVKDRVAEACREVALLWFVFALLDRLVVGTLTFPWAFTNGGFAIATWFAGLYIEIARKAR